MRIAASVSLLCLLSLTPAIVAAESAQTPARPPTIARSELSFAGIVLGDDRAKVRRTLGKPPQMTGRPGDHDYVFNYPGLDITFYEEGTVTGLSSSSPRRCTPSGACPGQTLAQAHAKLGRGKPPAPVDGVVEYYIDDESCWLELNLDADEASSTGADAAKARIEKLSVVCVP
ncbi:MAG: hypothetical protein ACREP7_23295 [Lysobacter sp.]